MSSLFTLDDRKVNLDIYKNRDNVINLSMDYLTTIGLPADLTGITFSASIREELDIDSDLIANFSVNTLSATLGQLQLVLPHTVSKSIQNSYGYYDLLGNKDGSYTTWMFGQIKFNGVATNYSTYSEIVDTVAITSGDIVASLTTGETITFGTMSLESLNTCGIEAILISKNGEVVIY